MKELPQNPHCELAHPASCGLCSATDQRYYWRSFTQPSYEGFSKSSQFVMNISSLAVSEEQGNLEVPIVDLDRVGTFWASAYPISAVAVGLARGTAEETPICMMGFTYCNCDTNAGVTPYEAYKNASKSTFYLKPLDSRFDYRHDPASEGTVFNKVTPRMIEGATISMINPELTAQLRRSLGQALCNHKLSSIHIAPLIWKGLRSFIADTDRFSNDLEPSLQTIFTEGNNYDQIIGYIGKAARDIVNYTANTSKWKAQYESTFM